MPSTYSGDPTMNSKDEVRFLSKDTGPTDFHLSDEEIEYLLSKEPNILYAAANAAEQIAAQISSKLSKTVGPLSIDYGKQAEGYLVLSADLRRRENTRHSEVQDLFTGEVTEIFTIGMTDNPLIEGGIPSWEDVTGQVPE